MNTENSKLKRKISVIGLGYVGLPIAVAFAKQQEVIAFDVSERRITALKSGVDVTLETEFHDLQLSTLCFTADPAEIKRADFHIIAVPTPINKARQPDLSCLFSASEIVGKQLTKGDIVVYESTVYPGTTEEECVPILEKASGLKCGQDFFVGYSPERINPGDKKHNFSNILKVVSGQNAEVLDVIAAVYSTVVLAGVYRANNIKVAEAAKIIENTQRDVNIALINELALIFEKLGIDTVDVLDAAATKWNFLPFKPGLVGGHCIGVDPYYLAHKASILGINPEVILSGRRINDNMGKYVAEQTIKQMIKLGLAVNGAKVAILGLTFKENCNDIRNTKVVDIITELRSYGVEVIVHDPIADPDEVRHEYDVELIKWENLPSVHAIVAAVAHDFYLQQPMKVFSHKLLTPKLIIDVKSMFDREQLVVHDINLWRL